MTSNENAIFWTIRERANLPNLKAHGILQRSSFRRAMSAVSNATSAPAPMAMPTSAAASEGASFTPSPTIATVPCSSFMAEMTSFLSPGRRPALYEPIPVLEATALAVASSSPVNMVVFTPNSLSVERAEADSVRTSSESPITPRISCPVPTNTAVSPLSLIAAAASAISSGSSTSKSVKSLGFPTWTFRPPTRALAPLPLMDTKCSPTSKRTPDLSASATIALARGCSDRASTDAAIARTSSARTVSALGTTAFTTIRPLVNVPVLSKATAFTFPKSSRWMPPFTRTPNLAALAMAATTVTGVEITKEQGQETISTVRPR